MLRGLEVERALRESRDARQNLVGGLRPHERLSAAFHNYGDVSGRRGARPARREEREYLESVLSKLAFEDSQLGQHRALGQRAARHRNAGRGPQNRRSSAKSTRYRPAAVRPGILTASVWGPGGR